VVKQETSSLLALAKQFRDGAAAAGRADVVAKIDEAILLLAGADGAAVDRDNDTSSVVLRILNGLGF
jgi:hypothetical protein